MRFDVAQPPANSVKKARQGPDLIDHDVSDLFGGERDYASAEPGQVGQTRVCSDIHACTNRLGHGFSDHGRVARVESASDVRRSDQSEQFVIVSEAVDTNGLS